jgi:hypothetical protein
MIRQLNAVIRIARMRKTIQYVNDLSSHMIGIKSAVNNVLASWFVRSRCQRFFHTQEDRKDLFRMEAEFRMAVHAQDC